MEAICEINIREQARIAETLETVEQRLRDVLLDNLAKEQEIRKEK